MAHPTTMTAFAIAGGLIVLAAAGTFLSGSGEDRSTPSDRLIRAGMSAPDQGLSVNRVRSNGRSLFSSAGNSPSASLGDSPAVLAPPSSSSSADRAARRFTENSLVTQHEPPKRRTVTSDRTRRTAGTSALERRRQAMANRNQNEDQSQSPTRSAASIQRGNERVQGTFPNTEARRDHSQLSPAEQIALRNGQSDRASSESGGSDSGTDPVLEQLLQQALENGWISESEAQQARNNYADRQNGSPPPVGGPRDGGSDTPTNGGSDNPGTGGDSGGRDPANPGTDRPSEPSEPSTPTNPIGGGSNGGIVPPITPGEPIDQDEIPDETDGSEGDGDGDGGDSDGGDGGSGEGDGGDSGGEGDGDSDGGDGDPDGGGTDPTDDPDVIDTSPEPNRIQAMWVHVPLLQFEPVVLPSSELLDRVRYELVLRSDQPLEYLLIDFGTSESRLQFVGDGPLRNTTSNATVNPQVRVTYPTEDEVNRPDLANTARFDNIRRNRAAELTESHFLFGEQPPVGSRGFSGGIGPSVRGLVFALDAIQPFSMSIQDSNEYGDLAYYFPVLSLTFTQGPVVMDNLIDEELSATFRPTDSTDGQTYLINASGVDLGALEEIGDAWVIPIEGEPFRLRTNHQ